MRRNPVQVVESGPEDVARCRFGCGGRLISLDLRCYTQLAGPISIGTEATNSRGRTTRATLSTIWTTVPPGCAPGSQARPRCRPSRARRTAGRPRVGEQEGAVVPPGVAPAGHGNRLRVDPTPPAVDREPVVHRFVGPSGLAASSSTSIGRSGICWLGSARQAVRLRKRTECA